MGSTARDREETAGRASNRWIAPAVIVAIAALLTVPAALGPMRLNDSFWIDWVWLDQFARELAGGNLYPRWLPLSHGGLGSPVFYFYPPLAFYLAALFAIAGLGIYAAIIATFFATSVLSGAAMYAWLNGQMRSPLLGSILFMIAPYHLFNFYQRGAVAEFAATAILPLVMLGIRRILSEERNGTILTALAFGALIAAHLPLALLASVFLFGPYALANSRYLVRIAGALVLGAAVAAIYLVPAIALQPYRNTADLWAVPYLQPINWTVWSAQSWSMKEFRAVLLLIGTIAIPLVSLLARQRSTWAIWAIVCALLGAGLLPFIWLVPGLSSVQFPFRLLPVAEFAFATAIAFAPRRLVPWPVLWLPLLAMGAFILAAKPVDVNVTFAELQTLHPDVPENLPPGNRPFSWPSRWALAVAAKHQRPEFDGSTTIEPVFYFPSWQVRCEGRVVRTFPAPDTQLLAHPGSGCSRRLVWTRPEWIGAALSLLAMLILAALAVTPALRGTRNRRNESGEEVNR